jgi:high-affinity nickel-transport protein
LIVPIPDGRDGVRSFDWEHRKVALEIIKLLSILGFGFLLGIRHATDPDHVIAISTIVSREREGKRSALIGAAWGVGHTLTILVVGTAIILFRVALPPRVGLALELAVGFMLIVLGLRNLGGLLRWWPWGVGRANGSKSQPAYHRHGDYVHAHGDAHQAKHPHDPERTPVARLDRRFAGSALYSWLRPLIIGVIHGLAGSAAIALLVLNTIPSPRWALAYLLVFGLGTILGMMLITLSLGSALSCGQKRFLRLGHHVSWASGVLGLGFGLLITYQIGFVDGLFTAHARWIPH